mmetsp:Transcript_428/g.1395  ORF Transcript_428/g.1395 Transcript_428/m.1395 type:complete len:234 (+) Transcript_428:167-868(+)
MRPLRYAVIGPAMPGTMVTSLPTTRRSKSSTGLFTRATDMAPKHGYLPTRGANMSLTVVVPCTSVIAMGTLTLSLAAFTSSTTSGSPAQKICRSTSTDDSSPVSYTFMPSQYAGTDPKVHRSNCMLLRKEGLVASRMGLRALTMDSDTASSRYGHALTRMRLNQPAWSKSRKASHAGSSPTSSRRSSTSRPASTARCSARPARMRRPIVLRFMNTVPRMKPTPPTTRTPAAAP